MRKFTDLYPWEVLDAVEAGSSVLMLDKACEEIVELRLLEVHEFFSLLKVAGEDKSNRFLFFVNEKGDDQNDTVRNDGCSEAASRTP